MAYSASSSINWQKVTLPYTSFQTAGLTNAVTAITLQAKQVVHAAYLNITQAFSGTTTLTLSFGPSGNLTKYVAAASGAITGVLASALTSTDLPSISGITNIQVNATATIQNLSSLSQGSVDVYLLISQLP